MRSPLLHQFPEQNHPRNRSGRQGFTLIELLTVMGIIGMLAAIVITAIGPQKMFNASHDAKRNSIARSMERAMTQSIIDSKTYPAVTQEWQEICDYGQTGACVDILSTIVDEKYVARPEKDIAETDLDLLGYLVRKNGAFFEVMPGHLNESPAQSSSSQQSSSSSSSSEESSSSSSEESSSSSSSEESSSSSEESSSSSAVCGNSIFEDPPEQCDDGNSNSSDGCDGSCYVETGWMCTNWSGCSTVCGDTYIVGSEQCDDGNTDSGDGCDSSCQTESSSSSE